MDLKKSKNLSPRIKVIQKLYNSLMNPDAEIDYPKSQYKKFIKDVVTGTLERSELIEEKVNTLLINDRTTTPTDIEFDENGSFVFTSNANMSGMRNNSISQNKLLENYQILSDAVRAGTFNCDHMKGADPRTQSGNILGQKSHDIEIHQKGRLFFFLDDSRRLAKFTASTPYDLNTLTFIE